MNAAAARRCKMALVFGVLLAFGEFHSAQAQTYPTHAIKFVVSFSAGGFVDTVARIVGQKLSQRLGQPVVIENKPGAAGNIAHRFVSGAAPDGYTILATSTALAINETLYPTRGYVGTDFSPVAIVATTPEILVGNATGPASLKEVVANAKTNPTNFGTAGAGSASFIVIEYFFKELAKAQATHIPFQGGAPLLNAILGKHIELAGAAMAGGFVPQVQSGALRGLAIASDKRVAVVPDVPTYAELGYPDFTAVSWAGFFAPTGTPPAIMAMLNHEIEEIMKDPEIVSKITPAGYDPIYGTTAEADALFRKDITKWRQMIEAIGLRVE